MRGSLTRRILAVNIVALTLVGASIFYLDGFRARLIDERRARQQNEAQVVSIALANAPAAAHSSILRAIGARSRDHFRIYDRAGTLVADSWAGVPPTYRLIDPAGEPWQRHAARGIDAIIDRLVGAPLPPTFTENPKASHWPELLAVMVSDIDVASRVRLAPDRTIMTSAATAIGTDRTRYLLSVENARDVRRLVRAERFRLFVIVSVALLLSAALSLFLARTIVTPLRQLARAAIRVRLGRAREVVVPRLPSRTDEIGLLARAVSDMSSALRVRIDATEAFAADVTHELKNPLASLASAVETLERVDDPAVRKSMLPIIRADVKRLDRLITDIAEISRLDAQLTRARFERVDLGMMIERLLATRSNASHAKLAFARPLRDIAVVMGDEAQLARAIENLIDNAISFSLRGGVVRIGATRVDDDILLTVEDEGPGVAKDARDTIFQRFYSDRPSEAAFGRHSGLGLAIAKTIVDGHNGSIEVADSESGERGARFIVRLPAA